MSDPSQLVVRPVEPSDKPLFVRGFERLSERSRYRRFMGMKKRLSDTELALFTELDHHDAEAIGAIDPHTGEGVGVARYVRLPDDSSAAEAAVAVVDDWQGGGVGRLLLERLVERARAEGIEHFRASLLTESRNMLHLFERIGTVRRLLTGGDELEIDVELPVDDVGCLDEALRAAASGAVERC